MTDEMKCHRYIAFSVTMLMECEREHGHGGMHHWSGTTMALDGTEKDIALSWSDDRKTQD